MKIYDCGDCYITTRLADWELLTMLQAEGWDIDEVTEVTEEEYLQGVESWTVGIKDNNSLSHPPQP